MKKTILIYGLPAVGKTTIVKHFATGARQEKPFVHYTDKGICLIGDYNADTPFLGTDKLSMSIQPTVINFIKSNLDCHHIIEGDRLFNRKFIEAINPIVLLIEAPLHQIKQRRIDRGVAQDEQFLKAKHTKIENIKSGYAHYSLVNSVETDIEQIRLEILNLLHGTSNLEIIQPAQPTMF